MNIFISTLNLLFIFSVSWWLWRKDASTIRKFYWPALIVKLGAGILMGIIYSTYYTDSDTIFFFNEAAENANRVSEGFINYFQYLITSSEGYFLGENRMRFFVKVVSVVCVITNNNYWIASIYFSFISFLSSWWLVKIIAKHIPRSTIPVVIAFLFFPSCVFWSSGIMKESLAMVAIFYLAAFFLQIWFKSTIRIWQIVVAVMLMWIGWNLKYYYLGLFIPIVSAAWLTKYGSEQFKLGATSQVSLLFVILFIGLLVASNVHPNFSINKIAEVIFANHQALIEVSASDDVIHFYNLQPNVFSLLINSPWAVFSGLFRPFIWEAGNVMQLMAALENLILLILTFYSLRYVQISLASEHRLLIITVLLYCVLLCAFLSLSSPNFGTLMRYRIGFLPFYVLLLFHQPFLQRLSKLLS